MLQIVKYACFKNINYFLIYSVLFLRIECDEFTITQRNVSRFIFSVRELSQNTFKPRDYRAIIQRYLFHDRSTIIVNITMVSHREMNKSDNTFDYLSQNNMVQGNSFFRQSMYQIFLFASYLVIQNWINASRSIFNRALLAFLREIHNPTNSYFPMSFSKKTFVSNVILKYFHKLNSY